MCVVCFVVIVFFFIYQGWIEVGIFGKLYRKLHGASDHNIDDSKKTLGSMGAAERADMEETRRKQESQLLRQSATIAARSNVRDSGSLPSSAAPSFSDAGMTALSISSVRQKASKSPQQQNWTSTNPLVKKLLVGEKLNNVHEKDEVAEFM